MPSKAVHPNAGRKRPDLGERNRSRHEHPIFPQGEDAGIKHCTQCCADKPFGEFYPDKKNAADGRRSNCKECQRAASNVSYFRDHEHNKAEKRQRQQQQTAEAYRQLVALKSAPCADCGGRFPAICMDFDHVSGEKIMAVSRMVSARKPLPLILAEVAKCEVVCANCHRLRTANRAEWGHLKGIGI